MSQAHEEHRELYAALLRTAEAIYKYAKGEGSQLPEEALDLLQDSIDYALAGHRLLQDDKGGRIYMQKSYEFLEKYFQCFLQSRRKRMVMGSSINGNSEGLLKTALIYVSEAIKQSRE